MIYPWQQVIWQKLTAQTKADKLPSAILIAGNKGIGKLALVEEWIQFLFCERREAAQACGQCQACHLLAKQSHPDFLTITRLEDANAIKIEQVRVAIDFMQATAFLNGYKIVLLYLAEWLNTASTNALLKIIEEPPIGKKLFILISENPSYLLPTLLSRMQKINMGIPTEQTALAWLAKETKNHDQAEALKLALGGPLLAKQYLVTGQVELFMQFKNDLIALSEVNLLNFAKKWSNQSSADLLLWLTLAVRENIRQVNRQQLRKWLGLLDSVNNYQAAMQAKITLNMQMMLEVLLYEWTRIA